jgi:hypothetical protein
MHKSTFFACADASSNEVLRLPGRGSGLAPAATPGFRFRPQPVTCAVSRRYSQSNVASPEPRALRRAGLGVEVDAVLPFGKGDEELLVRVRVEANWRTVARNSSKPSRSVARHIRSRY